MADPQEVIKRELSARLDEVGDWLGDRVFGALFEAGLLTEVRAKVEDLDRCEHGRHSIDPCLSCPDGWSTGNLFLVAGQRIGTNLAGQAIVAAPVRPDRG